MMWLTEQLAKLIWTDSHAFSLSVRWLWTYFLRVSVWPIMFSHAIMLSMPKFAAHCSFRPLVMAGVILSRMLGPMVVVIRDTHQGPTL